MARDVQKDSHDAIAEGTLAREKVEEFPLDNPVAILASGNAPTREAPERPLHV
jgi:hypothetical protein